MADGNYNRSILPYRQYDSGLKAGKAQMITKACRALLALLEEDGRSAQDIESFMSRFRQRLTT